MNKLFSAILLASFFVTGTALAQTTGTSAGTSTASTTLNFGQQVRTINKDAETQIRALQQELETKIKALRDEYSQKVRDIRTNAQNQIKALQPGINPEINREGMNRSQEENGSTTTSTNENRGRFMNFFLRLFGR